MTKNIGDPTEKEVNPLTLLEVMSSVLSAAFGVQSKAKKERDFRQGKPIQFIIAGITFTGIFLAGLISLVNLLV